ncbi:hypothetical protein FBY26_0065 [Phycicoccus sp. SLBN-51]|nr:hypothetical protein FBY26_0065 [Phycicoccus sp. SLBN-51]
MTERAYEVRVAGLVPTQDLLEELSDVEVAEHEFRTVLTGHFADQAALHGFLHRLRAFGLEVVEVRRVTATEAETTEPTATHAAAQHASTEPATTERAATPTDETGTPP